MTTNLEVPTQTAALKAGWLDAQPTNTTALNPMATNTNLPYQQSGTYTAYWPYQSWYYYPIVDHRPIKLGLSEVEKLRSAAKRDAKLKKILEKFTDQIEVVVDFK